jgi:hypothetical protein
VAVIATIPKAESSFVETGRRSKDYCLHKLLSNFRRFTIKHDVRNILIKRVNYVEIRAFIGMRGMKGCEKKWESRLY